MTLALAFGLLLSAGSAEESAKLMERLNTIVAEADRIRDKAEPAHGRADHEDDDL
ncbi:MAG: hypothetical protein WC728_13450 [Elusimicrobiota bacterium]